MTWANYSPSGTLQKAFIWLLAVGVALSGLAGPIIASTACPGGNASEPGRTETPDCCCSVECGGCCATACCPQQNSEPAEPIAPARSAAQRDTQDISVLSLAQQSEVQDRISATPERYCVPFDGQKNFSLQTQHVRLQA